MEIAGWSAESSAHLLSLRSLTEDEADELERITKKDDEDIGRSLLSSLNALCLNQEGTMAVKTSTKAIIALTALKSLQEDAKRKGLDKLSMDEINAEIARQRQEKRLQSRSTKNR